MFRFPNKDGNETTEIIDLSFFPVIETNSIKAYIRANVVTVGSKFRINGYDITCVHIGGDDYIFAFDDCINKCTVEEIPLKLKAIYNDTEIIPAILQKEIEYLFIPTEYQIFGKNQYSDKTEDDIEQFNYYKENEAHRVKNLKGEVFPYWTSSPDSSNASLFCFVGSNGGARGGNASSTSGLAVHFVIKK
jgi:hypothetical protein